MTSKDLDKTAPADFGLVALYLSFAGCGGADVRFALGAPYRVKGWPWASIPQGLSTWRIALAYEWPSSHHEHIQLLELTIVVNTLRWMLRTSACQCVRRLRLVVSQGDGRRSYPRPVLLT